MKDDPITKRAYQRRWRAANRERCREYSRRGNARAAVWRATNPRRARYNDLKRKYGLSREQYDRLFVQQGSACAACGTPEPGSVRGWHVDHDHASGKLRGILCSGCNLALGHVKDDRARLLKLIRYLEGAAP